MATVHLADQWNQDEFTHPYWVHSFTPDQRRQLLSDDAVAWKRICTILLSIVAGGLGIGLIGVVLTLWIPVF